MASSMRVSVLSRSLPMRQTSTTTSSFRDRENGLSSSASSVKSAVRSTSESYLSAMSGSTIGGRRNPQSNGGMSPAKMIVRETRASGGGSRMVERKDRPDSKLTPSVLSSSVESRRTPSPSLMQPSILESEVLEEEDEDREDEDEDRREQGDVDRREDRDEEGDERGYDDNDVGSRNGDEIPVASQPIKKVLITRASLSSVTSRSTLSSLNSGTSGSVRPKSSASSVRSQNTVRRSVGSTAGANASSMSRPRLSVAPAKTPVSRPTRTPRISTTSTTRPTSSLSSVTDSTATTFHTAITGLSSPSSSPPRTRQIAGASITRTLR